LLQTLYQAFDKIAKRRRVFKVETIGDSYLAVTGLPDPQVSHATIMAKFAWETLIKMGEVTKELEVSLGPDTGECLMRPVVPSPLKHFEIFRTKTLLLLLLTLLGELSMRLGLNSGSVTAGVLKGDRARFQLFGDTVNTAARMESTGMKGRIQISESTAALLKQAGKSSWLTPRADMVSAKGKGIMSTYWLALKNTGPSVATGGSSEDAASRAGISTKDLTPMSTSLRKSPKKSMDERAAVLKEARLVDWVTEMLLDKIKKVVIVHQRCHIQEDKANNMYFQLPDGQICLDEVKEVITMPTFDLTVAEAALDSHDVEAPQEIASMLREYVTLIARSYRGNPFHNFEVSVPFLFIEKVSRCHAHIFLSLLLSACMSRHNERE
jgi:class 3 adenylate cyclase